MRVSTRFNSRFPFGPFNSFSQKRWKKPVDSAQIRLESRTRDSNLDKLQTHLHKLQIALTLIRLLSNRRRGPFVSLQLASRWKNLAALNVPVAAFLRKHPHIFNTFSLPPRNNPSCCRITPNMAALIREEEDAIRVSEPENVRRLKKLLMMSRDGALRLHALRMVRREMGLPEDFQSSILGKYSDDFRLVDLETVSLIGRDAELGVAEVEKWREKEYMEKWLSEFETKYAFPVNFPTGFKKERGSRERLRNWQRLQYVKPYESKEGVRPGRSSGVGMQRFEKRVVAMLHEFLSLTVEKKVEIDQLVHFRRDLGMELNMRELLLKHPGIFYISTKGNAQTVFLREAYHRGVLIELNPIYAVRRKMLDLLLLGQRHTRDLQSFEEETCANNGYSHNGQQGENVDGDWILPIFESYGDQHSSEYVGEAKNSSEEDFDYKQGDMHTG